MEDLLASFEVLNVAVLSLRANVSDRLKEFNNYLVTNILNKTGCTFLDTKNIIARNCINKAADEYEEGYLEVVVQRNRFKNVKYRGLRLKWINNKTGQHSYSEEVDALVLNVQFAVMLNLSHFMKNYMNEISKRANSQKRLSETYNLVLTTNQN